MKTLEILINKEAILKSRVSKRKILDSVEVGTVHRKISEESIQIKSTIEIGNKKFDVIWACVIDGTKLVVMDVIVE